MATGRSVWVHPRDAPFRALLRIEVVTKTPVTPMLRARNGSVRYRPAGPARGRPVSVARAGRYVDDVTSTDGAGLCPALAARPCAHRVDRRRARRRTMPGVLLVLTGEDRRCAALGTQLPRMPRKRKDGAPASSRRSRCLARERGALRRRTRRLRRRRDARSGQGRGRADRGRIRAAARDRSTEEAILPGALAVWEKCPDNDRFLSRWGDKAAVDAAIAKAAPRRAPPHGHQPHHRQHHGAARLRRRIRHADDRYIIRCTVQAPTAPRARSPAIFKVPETAFRVIADNIGGGFGMKGDIFPEYALAAGRRG